MLFAGNNSEKRNGRIVFYFIAKFFKTIFRRDRMFELPFPLLELIAGPQTGRFFGKGDQPFVFLAKKPVPIHTVIHGIAGTALECFLFDCQTGLFKLNTCHSVAFCRLTFIPRSITKTRSAPGKIWRSVCGSNALAA